MSGRQRIVRVRRQYNQWVANQTLEDYALRFTAESARRWSALRVGHTALAAISFLALEAIGGAMTLSYGFNSTMVAILLVGAVIFFTGLPISYYAARYGVDIDLLTRGAGFGYIGSTITSLIYASFTFIFFAIEAAIMALALEMCFGLPLALGYIVSSVIVIPLVTHGITLISRFQIWTQPLWIALHLLPVVAILWQNPQAFREWISFPDGADGSGGQLSIVMVGAAASIAIALVAQIGEQVDVLRFLPQITRGNRLVWWSSLIAAGPGWIVPGMLKMAAGSFLAVLAIGHGVAYERAAEPTQMYLVAFGYVTEHAGIALFLMTAFVVLSQLKINVTNAYAGSIAWSNFFSRLTHSHPGRVVWLFFNVAIALLLMELGIYRALEQTLGLYAIIAISWVGALVADLVINKPLGLSPPGIEFKRAHLYDFNPVGVGAMLAACALGLMSFGGMFGDEASALAPFVSLGAALVASPLIALATGGRYYLARKPDPLPQAGTLRLKCCVCENQFERADMAGCPVYAGPICSLCCSLDARCHDACKPKARLSDTMVDAAEQNLPDWGKTHFTARIVRFAWVFTLVTGMLALILSLIYFQASINAVDQRETIASTLWAAFFILSIISGIGVWLLILADESRRFAEAESEGQTTLLLKEIEAHGETDAKLQRAKDAAEAANQAKSRYVVGIGHELRTPLNAILGYAQLMERDDAIPAPRQGGVRVIRRSAEHLSGLIDGLLDISRIESGRLQLARDEVRLPEFLDQIVDMFRLQAQAKGLGFEFKRPVALPAVVATDEKRLRQVLINLLSNAIKYTPSGSVSLSVSLRSGVAEFTIADTGPGIPSEDVGRIFEPFERGRGIDTEALPGIGLGLTITKLLTEIMGGEIRVSSEPGAGTTFRARLLLNAIARPSVEKPEAVRLIRGYAGPRRTIIVADDDPVHRDLMREVLVPLGFTLLTAPDGQTCLTLAEECRPDLFILDISMPGMNGFELARRLRERGQDDMPILMVSANMIDPAARRPDDAHDAILSKPVDITRLQEKIRELVGLEWVYDAEPAPDPVPAAEPAPRGSLARSDVDELRRLGRIGYIRGIEAKLARLSQEPGQDREIVEGLAGHIRNFDLRSFMADLEDIAQ